jgi:peptidoglycan/xylan/chitin deacetylase (PgdA/CDA1 family)
VPGTLVLTFDNLGEASELERGGDPPVPHPSVTDVLPRLLDELEARDLAATFFVEAINCELNPEAVRSIGAHGHELAMHGWRHEPWAELPVERERELLHRGVNAFAELGVRVQGFRPPGGELTQSSAALLREAGFQWCSPAADAFARRDQLAIVPFEWKFVDAYHLMDRFAELRARRGDPGPASAPSEVRRAMAREIDRLAAEEGRTTFVLHPFLMLEAAWFDRVCGLLDRACERSLTVLSAGRAACLRP